MQRSTFPWFWVVLAAVLLLLPGTAGRLLLDVLGGVTLLVLLLPLLAVGAGALAWQAFRRRLTTCPSCGTSSFGTEICPGCGSPLAGESNSTWNEANREAIVPGQMTIDVEAVDVTSDGDGTGRPSL
jgi:hypothetical protein